MPRESGSRRDTILCAARVQFAEQGYDATSVRRVARTAGVDPALVLYHFKSKSALLRAALDRPPDFVANLHEAMAAADRTAAEAAWSRAVRSCSSGADALACHALLRSLGSHQAIELTREAVMRLVTGIVAGTEHEGVPISEAQAAHALSRLLGWLLLRELLGVSALTEQSIEAAASTLAARDVRPDEHRLEPL